MTLVRTLALAALVAATTALLGWLAVPAVAFGAGMVRGRAGAPTAASALGWAALLAVGALRGPLWPLAERVGGVLGAPPPVLVALTVGFAALLGWAAATVGAAVARAARGGARPLARGGRGR